MGEPTEMIAKCSKTQLCAIILFQERENVFKQVEHKLAVTTFNAVKLSQTKLSIRKIWLL